MILNHFTSKIIHRLHYNYFKYSLRAVGSVSSNLASDRFKINIIPALKDNYMYLFIDNAQKNAIAIDPVEPEKIFECVEKNNASLKAVLTTHHHFDHAGGNTTISEKIKDIPIYGGDDRIEALTIKLSHNEEFQIGETVIKCLHTPCHTSGHVCYFINSSEPICFTGDTLFVGGCGRFFEGSGVDMFTSLNTLTLLPHDTKIYCGHEYTVSNLKFALSVEPGNSAILNRLKRAEESLKKMEPTVPSTIKDELSFNPFLRSHEESIKNFTQQSEPSAVIEKLRELKNNFAS